MINAYRAASAVIVPSQMESLSIGLAEPLLLSKRILASPIPVHQEVAGRIGRAPEWLPPSGGDRETMLSAGDASARQDMDQLIDQWTALADGLGLAPTRKE